MLSITRFAIALWLVLVGSLAFAQEPTFWALVHTGDALAKGRILRQTDFARAQKAADELGYEAVVEGQIAYFFPAPSWSSSMGQALSSLLGGALSGGFGHRMPLASLPGYQQDQLRGWLANPKVGGDLDNNMRTTKQGQVSLSRSVDFKFNISGRDVVVPIGADEIVDLFSTLVPTRTPEPASAKAYPNRPELFGLMSKSFAVDLSRPVPESSFHKFIDRAKLILKKKQDEMQAEIEGMVAAVFDQKGMTDEAKRLSNGETLGFDELPEDVKGLLINQAKANPEAFGFAFGGFSESVLRSAYISVPSGGMRVFVNFLLDGGAFASDGSPIRYSVGWSISDFVIVNK
jgi:hypothetical protein